MAPITPASPTPQGESEASGGVEMTGDHVAMMVYCLSPFVVRVVRHFVFRMKTDAFHTLFYGLAGLCVAFFIATTPAAAGRAGTIATIAILGAGVAEGAKTVHLYNLAAVRRERIRFASPAFASPDNGADDRMADTLRCDVLTMSVFVSSHVGSIVAAACIPAGWFLLFSVPWIVNGLVSVYAFFRVDV